MKDQFDENVDTGNGDQPNGFEVETPARRKSRKVLIAWSLARIALLLTVGIAVLLLLFQRRMIYLPRSYGSTDETKLPAGAVKIDYSSSQGRQTAFYLPPGCFAHKAISKDSDSGQKQSAAPARLWVLFGGNAMRALDWIVFVRDFRDRDAGILLIDYPGYGFSEGSPTSDSIRESAEAALAAFADGVHGGLPALEQNLNTLGISLGAAVALEFATRHPVKRVILMALFTSLYAMAKRTVGWPLACLLYDRYDNRRSLAVLNSRPEPPTVDLVHGKQDSIVPITMGRSLAKEFPKMVRFHPVDNADHNDLLWLADGLVDRLLDNPDRENETGAVSPM